MYAPVLKYIPEMSVAAVADADAAARTEAQRTLHVSRVYESVDDMLSDAKLDAVLVVTPVFCHLEHVAAAAKAGVHVMVEKPMAPTSREAKEMVEICRRAGVLLMVGFNRRLLSALWTATQMVKAGELGGVFASECVWTSWTMKSSGGSRNRFECLGGVFQDHGSHTVDLAQQWLGPATSVYAQAHRVGPSVDIQRDVEDHMTALVTHEGGKTSLHVHSRDSHRPISELYRIYGTEGTLELEYTGDWSFIAPDNWDMRLYREGKPVPQRLVARRPGHELLGELPDGHYGFYAELRRFAKAVISKSSTVSPCGEEGLSVVRILSAAFLSAAEGRSVCVDEADRFDEAAFGKLLRTSTRQLS
jgi:predicted dehydrogenase